jgi:hypothetical protein
VFGNGIDMIKIIVAALLLAHGLGHSMGLLQVFKVAVVNPQWNGDSWLLTGPIGTTLSQAIGVVVWTIAIVGFAAASAVVFGWLPGAWWQPLAIGSAVISLAGLLLFPTAFPTFSTLGALAVNVAVIVAVLWFHWMPSDVAG